MLLRRRSSHDPARLVYLAEGNATQPRKRVAAEVLIRDDTGRILLVDPTYKPNWDVPGGMVEANEPPRAAAARELREELGLILVIGQLLCVEWVPPHEPWDDTLVFLFDGGVLNPEQVTAISIADDELATFEFVTHQEAARRLRPYVWERLSAGLSSLASGPRYVELS